MQVFSCYRGWKEACQATRAISTTSRRKRSSISPHPQGKASKEFHAILRETLGERAPLNATVKNWVAQFKRGDFSTCDAPSPVLPKTVTIPEITDQIHELILEDHRISAKSIAEQLGTSHERVGSIIHEDLDMRKLSWLSYFAFLYYFNHLFPTLIFMYLPQTLCRWDKTAWLHNPHCQHKYNVLLSFFVKFRTLWKAHSLIS